MDIRVSVVICGFLMLLVKSEINYIDCGSSFELNSVEVEDCIATPCSVSPGETRTLTVNAKNLVPDVYDMHSRAYISFMGQLWELEVTPNSPCLAWGCPLHESRTRTYKGDVHFSTLIRRPALLTLSATLNSSNGHDVAFCVSLYVDFI